MGIFSSTLFHCSFGYMFRAIVPLEGEPLRLSAMFSLITALYLPPSIFLSALTTFAVPHSHSMMLPPPSAVLLYVVFVVGSIFFFQVSNGKHTKNACESWSSLNSPEFYIEYVAFS
ncbi:hypothetical protein XENOCAPTIV_002239 [Xenoophorus captivus]|uniref:Uncharacterized protein n=1 Tax=Xenoophorus captivus TaxID=1517983 RepID=A0ABV0QYX4_9TELE